MVILRPVLFPRVLGIHKSETFLILLSVSLCDQQKNFLSNKSKVL